MIYEGETPSEITPVEIWELIRNGSKVSLQFENSQAAEQFRIRLAQLKFRSEERLLSIGFMEREAIQSLIFLKKFLRDETAGALSREEQLLLPVEVEIHIGERRVPKTFKILGMKVTTPEDQEDLEASVSPADPS